MNFDPSDFHGAPWNWNWDDEKSWEHIFGLASLGIFAAFFALLAMLYAFLVAPVFKYGGDIIFVKAVRKIKPDFEYLDKGIYGELPSHSSCKSSCLCTDYSWIVCPYCAWNNYCMQACICILYSHG